MIVIFSVHLLEGTETLRSLGKERKTQKSSLISKEKVDKVQAFAEGEKQHHNNPEKRNMVTGTLLPRKPPYLLPVSSESPIS